LKFQASPSPGEKGIKKDFSHQERGKQEKKLFHQGRGNKRKISSALREEKIKNHKYLGGIKYEKVSYTGSFAGHLQFNIARWMY